MIRVGLRHFEMFSFEGSLEKTDFTADYPRRRLQNLSERRCTAIARSESTVVDTRRVSRRWLSLETDQRIVCSGSRPPSTRSSDETFRADTGEIASENVAALLPTKHPFKTTAGAQRIGSCDHGDDNQTLVCANRRHCQFVFAFISTEPLRSVSTHGAGYSPSQ